MAEGRTGMLGRLSKVASHLAAGADLVRVQLPDGDAAVPELFGPQRGGRSVDKNHGNLHEDFPAPGRPPPAEPVPGYLAHTVPSAEQLHSWVEKFHTDGFLYLPKVLPPALCAKLREDLDWVLENAPAGEGSPNFHPRMFELSAANLSLFEIEPIVSFVKYPCLVVNFWVRELPFAADSSEFAGLQAEALIDGNCHVVHNNSFTSPGGKTDGKGGWHQDDRPHVTTTDGKPLPSTTRLAVQLFTANYILTDVDTPDYGPTECVRGSHLFGRSCIDPDTGEPSDESEVVAPCGPAGSVCMFNNQVWHRGRPNFSDRTRYITQISYASYLVGHKFFPFMNYEMPEYVMEGANPRLMRLLGFQGRGAYT